MEQLANLTQTAFAAPAAVVAAGTVETITVVPVAGLPAEPSYRLAAKGEIMLVKGVAGGKLTVERGAENTAPAAHAAGDPVLVTLTKGALEALIEGGGGGGGAFTPTAVKNAAYEAKAADYIPVDISAGSVTITLPNAPVDKTRIGVKIIAVSGTPGSTSLTIKRSGTDVFNLAGGSTALTLNAKFQSVILQYQHSTGIWYVQTTDTPLNEGLGAALLGTDGTVGGPSGSALAAGILTDARGAATGDLLQFNGATFVRLPRGEPGEFMLVKSDGTISYIKTETYVDAWGAKGDGVTDDTAAIQAASEHFAGPGGGAVLRYSAGKTYIVDGLKWQNKIIHQGAGINSTILKAKAGSTNPGMIELAAGRVTGGWHGFEFAPNGNEGQHCFYLAAQESAGVGGVWSSFFENLAIFGFTGCGMWFRGGATNFQTPHQFNVFRNVGILRPNTGPSASTNRAFKATGQCEKFQFDSACIFQGNTNLGEGQNVGTNIELSREFLETTTLTAESAAAATVLTVGSVAGLEAKKLISVGEGNFNELAEVQSIEGLKVTLKTALTYAHAAGTRLYALSGTVGAPATIGPAIFLFDGCSFQNADLDFLIDTSQFIVARGCDLENQTRCVKARHESYEIRFLIRMEPATEGVSQGTGTLTVGSNVITGASTTWKNGDVINGRGIPAGGGVTVTAGGGTATIEISHVIEPTTGSAGSMVNVPLVKGGKGEGYIAKFGAGCQGTIEYYPVGGIDNAVIAEGEHAVRVRDLARRANLLNQTSTGVTIAKGTAATLGIGGAAEVVLTNATTPVTNLSGLHAVGERVVIRASAANTKLEAGGNIGIPAGTLTLAINDTATFQRTDFGETTWVLVGVSRASELLRGEVDPAGAAAAAQAAAEAASDKAGAAAAAQAAAEAVANTKLAKASNLSDLASAATARTNLGLGTAATQPSSAFDVAGAASTEQARAEAAENLKLAKASNLSDLASAATARTNLGLGTAATQASGAFDAAGAAATAQAAAEAAASAAISGLIAVSGEFNAKVATGTTLALSATVEKWLLGKLEENTTVKLSAFPAKSKAKFQMQQDGVGSRVLTIEDPAGHKYVPVIPTAPFASFDIYIECPDGQNLYISVQGNPQAPAFNALATDMVAIKEQTVLQEIALPVGIGTSFTEIWKVTWLIRIKAEGNKLGEMKFGLGVPSGCTATWGAVGGNGPLGFTDPNKGILNVGAATEAGVVEMGTLAGTMVAMLSAIIFGGGTEGNVVPKYAQIASNVEKLQVLKGSLVESVQVRP